MQLTFTDGPLAGRNVEVEHGIYQLGREDDNELIIDDESLSRHHCRLYYQDGHWWLKDLASANGVYIDGVRIDEPIKLVADMAILIGRSRFVVKRTDSAGAETQPAPAIASITAGHTSGGETIAAALEQNAPPKPILKEAVPPKKKEAAKAEETAFAIVAAAAIVVVSLGLLAVNIDSFESLSQAPLVSSTDQPVDQPDEVDGATDVVDAPIEVAVDAPPVDEPAPPADEPTTAAVDETTDVAVTAAVDVAPVGPDTDPTPQDATVVDVVPQPEPVADTAEEPVEPVATVVEDPVLDRGAVIIPKDLLPTPKPEPKRRAIRIHPVLKFGDKATLVRLFDGEWEQLTRTRPDKVAALDDRQQQELREQALVTTIRRINTLESTRRTELKISNTDGCWDSQIKRRGTRPLIIPKWVPTNELQLSRQIKANGDAHVVEIKHDMKGYDYGFAEPGREIIYRLTVLVDGKTVMQREFNVSKLPEHERRSSIIGGLDIPSHHMRTPSNTLFRHYAAALNAVRIPGYTVQAIATRRPIPGDYVTRIPASSWDLDGIDVTIERDITFDDWRDVIRESLIAGITEATATQVALTRSY